MVRASDDGGDASEEDFREKQAMGLGDELMLMILRLVTDHRL
jgi:hypothetical protein